MGPQEARAPSEVRRRPIAGAALCFESSRTQGRSLETPPAFLGAGHRSAWLGRGRLRGGPCALGAAGRAREAREKKKTPPLHTSSALFL